jgi:hypothetical protein
LKFFEAVKNLFPRSRAFSLLADNNGRKLAKSLAALPEDARSEAERVFLDVFPDTTRNVSRWRNVFGVVLSQKETAKQREILSLYWRLSGGGQSAVFLESALRVFNQGVRVTENVPLKNPRDSNVLRLCANGYKSFACGNKSAVNNFRTGNRNFEPTVLMNGTLGPYSVKNDPSYWPSCFYVGGGAARDEQNKIMFIQTITIEERWRNMFEYFVLRLKPLHATAVLYIDWKKEDDDD